MEPTNFEGSNIVFGPPPGVGEDQVRSIFGYRGPVDDWGLGVITCWKLTQEDLAEVQRTGRVWLALRYPLCVPHVVTAFSPFRGVGSSPG